MSPAYPQLPFPSAATPERSFLHATRIPSPVTFLWEAPFWAALLYGSLVPASRSWKGEWLSVPVRLADCCLLASAAFYSVVAISRLISGVRIPISWRLLASTILLFLYGIVSLSWAPLDSEDRYAMAFALLLSISAPLQALGVMSRYDAAKARSFLNRLTFFLALLSLLYACESVFNLGLRSEEGAAINSSFGIQRVRGPLYGASTGYFLLLPAIGWSLQIFFSQQRRRLLALLMAGCLLAALMGLGSRAAIILLGLYGITLPLLMKSLKQKVLSFALLAMLCGGAAFLVYGRADTQRLQSMEDGLRGRTHETAMIILSESSLPTLLTGQGYANIWNWYRFDFLHTASIAQGNDMIRTPYGLSLYHCHSTLLEAIVEFGAFGLLWLLILAGTMLRLAMAPVADPSSRFFTSALAISLVSLGFDLYFFKEARVSSIWWLYTMGAFVIRRKS
jgi:hypothetical protein